MHVERKSYKCHREKIQKQQNTEMAGVTLVKFFSKKGRKISKLYIFTCCQVPASLFYFQILKKKEEKWPS